MALAPGGAPKTQGPAAAWRGRGGDIKAALSLVPGPTRAALSRQTPAWVVRAAGSSDVWRQRLLWLNQHAPSHVCIGQHDHQINY